MQPREGEAESQARLSKRLNEVELASREYVNKHAREIGVAEGMRRGIAIGMIHFAQRLLNQPLTPKEELTKLASDDLTTLADELEWQVLSLRDTP
jgi:hypothetical protein